MFALVFAAAVALAFLLTRSITQPLARLGALMDRMDVGSDVAVEPLRYASAPGDEIGVLVDRYNRMAEKVRVSALALARAVSGKVRGGKWPCRWRMKSRTR